MATSTTSGVMSDHDRIENDENIDNEDMSDPNIYKEDMSEQNICKEDMSEQNICKKDLSDHNVDSKNMSDQKNIKVYTMDIFPNNGKEKSSVTRQESGESDDCSKSDFDYKKIEVTDLITESNITNSETLLEHKDKIILNTEIENDEEEKFHDEKIKTFSNDDNHQHDQSNTDKQPNMDETDTNSQNIEEMNEIQNTTEFGDSIQIQNSNVDDFETLKMEVEINPEYVEPCRPNSEFYERKKLLDQPITRLQCNICPSSKQYKTAQSLSNHMQTHLTKDDKKYNCSICNAIFDNNEELVYHKLTHKGDGDTYFCLECKLAFSEHLDWQLHNTSHKDYKIYKCQECYKFFILKSVYQGHLEVHYDREIVCKICNEKFKTQSSYKDHMKFHLRSHECCECGKLFASGPQLDIHLYNHIGYRPFQCHYCGLAFFTKPSRDNHHRVVHIADRPYKCKSCDKAFKTPNDLEKHIQHRHLKIKAECSICLKKVAPQHLQYHMLLHEDPKFTCQVCGGKFAQLRSLQVHMVYRHTEEKPLKCDFCGLGFKTKRDLLRHSNSHKKEKYFDLGVFQK